MGDVVLRSKLSLKDVVYMIRNNKNNFVDYKHCYATRFLAELIMEARYSTFWLENKYVEVIEVPIMELKREEL